MPNIVQTVQMTGNPVMHVLLIIYVIKMELARNVLMVNIEGLEIHAYHVSQDANNAKVAKEQIV